MVSYNSLTNVVWNRAIVSVHVLGCDAHYTVETSLHGLKMKEEFQFPWIRPTRVT